MSKYVMSDIHGYHNEFLAMLSLIDFSSSDELYILGDIIDRGPDSLGMLQEIIGAPDNIHLILGNHEDMMLTDTNGNSRYLSKQLTESGSLWLPNGGFRTLAQIVNETTKEWQQEMLNKLINKPVWTITEVNKKKFFLVHAGIDLLRPLKEQKDEICLWGYDEWFISADEPDIPIVFGHCPTRNIISNFHRFPDNMKNDGIEQVDHILHYGNRIAIDCGCGFEGNLGCLRLDDMMEFYVPQDNCQSGYIWNGMK